MMNGGNKKKKLSKDAILDQAKELFSKKGYSGTTINDLTSIFGVSKPSIYYYFKNKMEILLDLYLKGFNEATKDLDALLASNIPTKEKFRRILELHTRNAINDVKLQRIWYFDKMELPKSISQEISRKRREYTNRIISVFEQGIKEGMFKNLDPETAVYILIGSCNWLIMWYSDKNKTYPNPEIIVQTLLEILCEGYEVKTKP